MILGRMMPGRVEKQLKHITIVSGDSFQEFQLDCFFPFEAGCNVYRTCYLRHKDLSTGSFCFKDVNHRSFLTLWNDDGHDVSVTELRLE